LSRFDFIEMLRSQTANADVVSADGLAKSALVDVQGILSWFEADANCRLAGEHVTVKCQRLARSLMAMEPPSEAERSVIEDQRTEALAAIDKLREECERCGPSDKAKSLGI